MAHPPAADRSSRPTDASPGIPEPILLGMYRNIYATRRFELTCIEFYRQGLIRGYLHPYLGEEAVAAGACAALRPQDYIASTHRGHGHCISKGADLRLMMAEITGKATGYCKGRGGSMHISSKQLNHLGANGIVGAASPSPPARAWASRCGRPTRWSSPSSATAPRTTACSPSR